MNVVAPAYFLEKVARHGAAAERLRREIESGQGEFGDHDAFSGIAFDAADFVWAYLALCGHEKAQESRFIRNQIAEKILEVLRENEDGIVGPASHTDE